MEKRLRFNVLDGRPQDGHSGGRRSRGPRGYEAGARFSSCIPEGMKLCYTGHVNGKDWR